jgi:hypothetical protein
MCTVANPHFPNASFSKKQKKTLDTSKVASKQKRATHRWKDGKFFPNRMFVASASELHLLPSSHQVPRKEHIIE